MKQSRLAPVLCVAMMLSLPLSAGAADDKVLATVNGEPITEEMLQAFMMQRNARSREGAPAQSREDILKELVNVALIEQDAVKHKLDQQPNVQQQLQWHKRSVLVSAAMRDYLRSHPVTDEELKKAYDDYVATLDGKEYKARHILVGTEDEARKLIEELDGGADFTALAKAHSTGPTGPRGGDLGWFSTTQMVKPFGDAVKGLDKGQYTKAPIKTQFGWHVILLEDTRDSQPPAFDQLKPQLQTRAQNQRVQAYIDELRKGAKIDVSND